MAVDIAFFRRVMGQFATGVTIATTRSQEGIAGLTVNSFTSVSLHPLIVLICVDLRSQSLAFFRTGGVFAVNILSHEQEALSNCFSSSADERYNYFCHARHHVATTGAPILEGTMGFIDARIIAEYPGGDHAIFLGQVEAMGYDGRVFFLPDISTAQSTLPAPVNESGALSSNGLNGHNEAEQAPVSPLLYYQGKYHHISNRYHHQRSELLPTTQHHDE
ncbi:MAG TPA: flavin reductase family protein [Ktedonobacteraceae bacterium]